ncbi:Growth-regulating factor 1 [Linum perenne]
MHGVGGAFTPSQWMELEHQALIYKYLTANAAVPSNLLNPIKKSLYPFALSSSSSSASFNPSPLGYGAFHLGYPGSTNDPEPGRCRRTDGKKWRCSRDAFGDQKYCERHISKGRHRSRKPVEANKVVTTNSNAAAAASSANVRAAASNCIAITQQQQQLTSAAIAAHRNSSPDAFPNRFTLTDVNAVNTNGRFQVPRASEKQTLTVPKQNVTIEESPYSKFGHVSFDSSLNPSQHKDTTRSCYNSFLNFNGQDTQDQQSLHQFMDNDWPKDQSTRDVITWPEELKSDWTQLSMSIPMTTSSDFSSSSPPHKKLALSPLRLAREFNTMAQGIREKQTTTQWMPIPWGGGASLSGGPLGEALKTSTNGNMMTEELGFSPTGVLQKATFGSLSNNSSSGNSPRGDESKRSLCEDVIGSTIASSIVVPFL